MVNIQHLVGLILLVVSATSFLYQGVAFLMANLPFSDAGAHS